MCIVGDGSNIVNCLLGTAKKTLLVFEANESTGLRLAWLSQLNHIPIQVKTATVK